MGSPDEFHTDAHPDARDITGNLNYGAWGQCIAQSKRSEQRCEGHALGPHGKCNSHGGATPTKDENPNVGNGDQDDNTNALKHGLFVERSRYYRKVMDNLDRRVCDDIYTDYVEQFRQVNGTPMMGDLDTMWQIAVEHIQISHADSWPADRPDERHSGNPMVDRETHYSEGGQKYYDYKEAVTVSTKLKLRKEHRAWLKDNNLRNDPESQKAEAMDNQADAWRQYIDS